MGIFLAVLGFSGLYFAIFGARLLFEKGYIEKLHEGMWKPSKDNLFSKKSTYAYSRARGFQSLIVGLMFLGFVFWVLWTLVSPPIN